MGTTFTRAYCAAPVCNPSRAALMSGLRPGATGVYDNGHDWRPVIRHRVDADHHVSQGRLSRDRRRQDLPRLATSATASGTTISTPRQIPQPSEPVSDTPLRPFGPVDAPDSEWADYKSVDYGIAELQKKHEKPFFVAVGLHKPHMPWNVPRKYYDMHPLDQIELPPYREDDLDDLPPAAVEMAKPNEHEKIVESRRAGSRPCKAIWPPSPLPTPRSAVCSTRWKSRPSATTRSSCCGATTAGTWARSITGASSPCGKKPPGRRFIWIVPGVTQAGTRCERTVDFMSIYPTLCDLCGIETPKHVQGGSIRPLLADPKAAWDRPAITTYGRNNHAVRTEGWRYIRYADGGEELYDETNDPYEWTNLATQSQHEKQKSQLPPCSPRTTNPTPEPATPAQEASQKGQAEQKLSRPFWIFELDLADMHSINAPRSVVEPVTLSLRPHPQIQNLESKILPHAHSSPIPRRAAHLRLPPTTLVHSRPPVSKSAKSPTPAPSSGRG